MSKIDIWTIANQKGGVGKTTTTVTLAGLLAQMGKHVLVIDLDPHASLSHYFGLDDQDEYKSVFDIFAYPDKPNIDIVEPCIHPSHIENISVLPATMNLATLDGQFGQAKGMGLKLKHAIACVSPWYDVVLIDCPPILGVLMINALAASEHVIIPVQTEHLAIRGLDKMMQSLVLLEHKLHKKFIKTVVPTLFDKRLRATAKAYKELEKSYGEFLWSGVIPIDTHFRDASEAHNPASHMYPNSRGVKSYAKLLTYIQAHFAAKPSLTEQETEAQVNAPIPSTRSDT